MDKPQSRKDNKFWVCVDINNDIQLEKKSNVMNVMNFYNENPSESMIEPGQDIPIEIKHSDNFF
jgi:hypothetical protein